MTRPHGTDVPDTARISIGVRRYHGVTGTFTVLKEPQVFAGVGFDPLAQWFPRCECRRCCRERASR